MPELKDLKSRKRAVTTFDRTVIVEAGAGTGKTTLLAQRMIHLLFRRPDPVDVTAIIALTFTRKAAGEMAERLRRHLEDFICCAEGACSPAEDRHSLLFQEIKSLYGRRDDEIGSLAARALQGLEGAQITTIHGFAAQILRLYCREAHVDPAFSEDEGILYRETFLRTWRRWLEEEMDSGGKYRSYWETAMEHFGLEDLQDLATKLGRGLFPLDDLERAVDERTLFAPPEALLKGIFHEALPLKLRLTKDRKIECQTRAALEVIGAVLAGRSLDELPEEVEELGKTVGTKVKGLTDQDFRKCRQIIDTAGKLAGSDTVALTAALKVTIPAARRQRREMERRGFLTFDDLLVGLARLLREDLRVREALKRRYRYVLVDEFQDTDPLQYEIILYLAEKKGLQAATWSEIDVEPGKLFIVGDPRQSIYGFRRADIRAYRRVIDKLAVEQERLTVNFRSTAGLIGVVNGFFERIIRSEGDLQPAYMALDPGEEEGSEPLLPAVEIRLLEPPGKKWSVAEAAEGEALSLARWLATEVLGQPCRTTDPEGPEIRPRDIAVLMRKMTGIAPFIGALREMNIPVIVEGERNFFAAQEVVDLANILRAGLDPGDDLALAAVLRSPLGGLSDRQLLALSEVGFDYRRAVPGEIEGSDAINWLFAKLREFHQRAVGLSPSAAIDHLYREMPLLEAAAAAAGELGRANLIKARDMARGLEKSLDPSLPAFIRILEEGRIVESEGESPLAESKADAVRLMTIHQAKGLEFPVVVLPSLHSPGRGQEDRVAVAIDWSSGTAGMKIGDMASPGFACISHRARDYSEAEERRLLYVAATRAKKMLVFSGAEGMKKGQGKMLGFLKEVIETPGIDRLVGRGGLKITRIVHQPSAKKELKKTHSLTVKESRDFRDVLETWRERMARYKNVVETAEPASPSALIPSERRGASSDPVSRERALWIGLAVHRIMEKIPFDDPPGELDRLLENVPREIPLPPDDDDEEMTAEVRDILETFFASQAFESLRRLRVIGREMPILTASEGRVLEGHADLILEKEDQIIVADYKTEWVTQAEAEDRARAYLPQGRAYLEALSKAMGRRAGIFWVVFLRPALIIEISTLS